MRRFARNLGKTLTLISKSANEPSSLGDNLSEFKKMFQPSPQQIQPEIQPEIESSNEENRYSLLIYTGFVSDKNFLYRVHFEFFSNYLNLSTHEQRENTRRRLNNYRDIRQFILNNSQDNVRYDLNYLNPNTLEINRRMFILNIDLLLRMFSELNFNYFSFFVEVEQTIYFRVNGRNGKTTITYLINIMDSNFESFMSTPNIKYYSNRVNNYIDEFNIFCILMCKKEYLVDNEILENYLKTEYIESLRGSGITPRIFHNYISDIINLQIQCEIYAMSSNRIDYRPLKLVILNRNHPRNTYITSLNSETTNMIREYIRRQRSRSGIRGGEFTTKKIKKLRKYK